MANKDFKVKNGIDIQSPLPVSMGGTGQTSTTNTLNSLLPAQAGNTDKVLQTDGTNTTWYTIPAAYNRGNTASRPGSPAIGDLYYNTELNYFESYTANGWFPIAAAPLAPTGVTATNQGSGRAYDNGQMSVAFTPNSSGGAPTSFILTPSPSTSPSTFTGSTSPITVTGLASSTQYTYTVQSTSPYGTSAASTASSGVTATTVPQAPSLTASGGAASANITITPGATGGSAITQYSIISDPATTTQTTSNTTYTFTGLTDGTAYTFTATATNANGTSAASAASNSVTPTSWSPEGAYDALATITVGSTAVSNIEFLGIPTGYKHLQIRATMMCSAVNNMYLQLGSGAIDTSANYSWHQVYGDGSSPFSNGVGSTTFSYIGYNNSISYPNSSIVDIMDYANLSKFKTYKTLAGTEANGTGFVQFWSGNWRSTSAITNIKITPGSGNFTQHSTFALYGVK